MDETTEPSDAPADPFAAALEAVTGQMARRFAVRVDRLMAQVSDLAELEAQLAELTGELGEEAGS